MSWKVRLRKSLRKVRCNLESINCDVKKERAEEKQKKEKKSSKWKCSNINQLSWSCKCLREMRLMKSLRKGWCNLESIHCDLIKREWEEQDNEEKKEFEMEMLI